MVIMSVIPAGRLQDGSALTGLEAAVLISVDEWARENTDWFKYRAILKGGIIFSVIVIFAGLFATPVITLVGVLSTIVILNRYYSIWTNICETIITCFVRIFTTLEDSYSPFMSDPSKIETNTKNICGNFIFSSKSQNIISSIKCL